MMLRRLVRERFSIVLGTLLEALYAPVEHQLHVVKSHVNPDIADEVVNRNLTIKHILPQVTDSFPLALMSWLVGNCQDEPIHRR
jgi:hypothetical protein